MLSPVYHNTHTHTRTRMHTHTHTNAHSHTHTHTHTVVDKVKDMRMCLMLAHRSRASMKNKR